MGKGRKARNAKSRAGDGSDKDVESENQMPDVPLTTQMLIQKYHIQVSQDA